MIIEREDHKEESRRVERFSGVLIGWGKVSGGRTNKTQVVVYTDAITAAGMFREKKRFGRLR